MYDLFVPVLTYPDAGYLRHVAALREAQEKKKQECPEAPSVVECVKLISSFWEQLRNKSVHELEETFTYTFDMKPLCALDMGWHLFGEDYNRGVFLARMRRELAAHKIQESRELPDHITHVLLVLGRMTPKAAMSFAQCCVIPALDKMTAALGKQEKKENPYLFLLRGLQLELKKNHTSVLEEALS